MAAAAQTAAAAEAAAASFDLHIIDGRCRRLEARDMRSRDAALRRSWHHLTRSVLTRSACFGPKARKHDNPFGHLTKGQNVGEGLWKTAWFLVRPMFLRFPLVS